VFDLSLFEVLATRFAMWRADVHYKISITRTAFHVGRLEVVFVPGKTVDDGDVPGLDTTNCWRHVLDMTEQNEVEFVVPYMNQRPMCRSGSDPVGIRDNGPHGCVGSLIVRSVTPLSAPSTVSNFVQINVWKWATNVAFACPLEMETEVPPKVNVRFQSAEGSSSGDHVTVQVAKVITEAVRVIFQGKLANEPLVANTVAFGQPNTSSNTITGTTLVGGEMIANLRQATRGHRLWNREIPNRFVLSTTPTGGLGGYVGLCANIFAFYRGGMSFKLVPNTSEITRKFVQTGLIRTIAGLPNQFTGPSHLTYTDINPFHEVQTPFYCTTRRGICNRLDDDVDANTDNSLGVYVITDSAGLRAYVGGKDDLTFGFLIGPPIYGLNLTPLPRTLLETLADAETI
jgi:hypothetical protein